MALLRKVKASTLMETLVATVLIMVIFMLASMILNNLFTSNIKNDTRVISTKLNELEYLYVNDKLKLPYYDDYNHWDITVELSEVQNVKFIATNGAKTIEVKKFKNEN